MSEDKIVELKTALSELAKDDHTRRQQLLNELGALLCPFKPGQVMRWGGRDNRGSAVIVESVIAELGVAGLDYYWVVRAEKYDKRMRRSGVFLTEHQLPYCMLYADEPVDKRTAKQVKEVVQKKQGRQLKEVLLGSPTADW
jgi:hypothetical protein